MQKPTQKPTKESQDSKTNFADSSEPVELLSASLKLVTRVNFDLVLGSVILVLRWVLYRLCEIRKSQTDESTREPTRWGREILSGQRTLI